MDALTLETMIKHGIPLSQHMGFSILDLQSHKIVLKGDHQANINVHGTAFAGSLHTLCTLAAWGLITSHLPADAALVMAKSEIKYRKPVNADIIATAEIPEATMQPFLTSLASEGKARLMVMTYVGDPRSPAVVFSGLFYAS